jgi:hypothetical protein
MANDDTSPYFHDDLSKMPGLSARQTEPVGEIPPRTGHF